MDILDITAKEVNKDFLDTMLKSGQQVRIVRTVTISYDVYISDILGESSESGISVKDVIRGEEVENTINSVEMEFAGEVDIDDNYVIAVEIA